MIPQKTQKALKTRRVQPCTELTEREIAALRKVDDQRAAEAYDARARALERQQRRAFVEVGLILLEMSNRKLWAKLADPTTGAPFHSFEAWVMSVAGVSRRTAFSALKTVKGLGEVSYEDLRLMPRCNAVRLSGLSVSVQCNPEIISAAQTDTEADFVTLVQTLYPDQHLEATRTMLLRPSQGVATLLEDCFRSVAWVYGVEDREGALEALAAYYMGGFCEREGYTDKTNEEVMAEVKP
jgi:hypothetical protein